MRDQDLRAGGQSAGDEPGGWLVIAVPGAVRAGVVGSAAVAAVFFAEELDGFPLVLGVEEYPCSRWR
ncbi:MAG TPA: hypothetical protein VIJ00_14435 [Nakamurella sp.]